MTSSQRSCASGVSLPLLTAQRSPHCPQWDSMSAGFPHCARHLRQSRTTSVPRRLHLPIYPSLGLSPPVPRSPQTDRAVFLRSSLRAPSSRLRQCGHAQGGRGKKQGAKTREPMNHVRKQDQGPPEENHVAGCPRVDLIASWLGRGPQGGNPPVRCS